MGTGLFLLAKFLGRWKTPYDSFLVCLLISLDSATVLRYYIWRSMRR